MNYESEFDEVIKLNAKSDEDDMDSRPSGRGFGHDDEDDEEEEVTLTSDDDEDDLDDDDDDDDLDDGSPSTHAEEAILSAMPSTPVDPYEPPTTMAKIPVENAA